MATLNFKGKPLVWNHHLSVPYHQLVPRKDKSLTDKVRLDDNLIIHGDNLKALKALLPMYGGKVKCVYIDPPYNTGNVDWVYNDAVNSPMIKEWLGKEVQREDLTRHDKWLCMMTPRLRLLKDLLDDSGVILVSIDDHELHHLRCLMDEIFGEENYIAEMVWEGALKNDSRFVSISHDYILCYARNREKLTINDSIWRTRKEGVESIYEKVDELKKKHKNDYAIISEQLRKWYSGLDKNHPAVDHRHYSRVDARGVYFPSDISWPGGGGPKYQVLHPKTKKPVKVPNRGWVFASPDRMKELVAEDRVDFGDGEDKTPTYKRYLKETEGQVLGSVFYKDRRSSMQRLRTILGKDSFENPKDEEVLMKIIEATTPKNGVVLDAFGGSGTTGHAVLALNKLDGGNRRFILTESQDYADTVTAERLRRVIKGVAAATDADLKKGYGGTFSYFDLGDSLESEKLLAGKNLPTYPEMARYVFYAATGQEFDAKKIFEKDHYIGSDATRDVFLIYKPDSAYLRTAALTLDIARSLKSKPGRRKIVFAPTKYLDQEQLDELGIDFAQLPYDLYKSLR